MSTPQNCGKLLLVLLFVLMCIPGCEEPEPIMTYTVPTKIPVQFRAQRQRMLAAMLPDTDQVWFFKITGPQAAVDSITDTFKAFMKKITLVDGVPQLDELPNGWKRSGGKRQMRYATIVIETPAKQLDLAISKLPRLSDWDKMVADNVNRWRGQVRLERSQEKWAEAEVLQFDSVEEEGVWVDLVGAADIGRSMMPPMVGGKSAMVPSPKVATEPGPMKAAGSLAAGPTPTPPKPDPRLSFDRPEGWQDGRMNSFRMAAFNVGQADALAEITVIPAGGDLRGNVTRWIGQVRSETAPDDVVDQALQAAIKVKVDGRDGQRFLLSASEEPDSKMIDATIVPISEGVSLFIKMTGPYQTVSAQKEKIGEFLASLKFKQ